MVKTNMNHAMKERTSIQTSFELRGSSAALVSDYSIGPVVAFLSTGFYHWRCQPVSATRTGTPFVMGEPLATVQGPVLDLSRARR